MAPSFQPFFLSLPHMLDEILRPDTLHGTFRFQAGAEEGGCKQWVAITPAQSLSLKVHWIVME